MEGQTDILTLGIPFVSPYNPDGVMNPVLVMCMGLGYLFNMYRNKPLVREGGVIIMTHPTYRDFNPVHHPSYIDFFEQVLPDTTDPVVMGQKWEKQYAEDEWYRHLYRTGNAYHGVHPFYAWYWGAHGQQHAGKVIIVGGDPATVRRLGFTPASTMDDAFEIASDVVGRNATITHLHVPALLVADVKQRWATSAAQQHALQAHHRAAVAQGGQARRRDRLGGADRVEAHASARLPVPQADPPQGRRGARGALEAGLGLRDGLGAQGPGPLRPQGRSPTARCRRWCKALANPDVVGLDRLADLEGSTTRRP